MHRLLKLQLKRIYKSEYTVPDEMREFVGLEGNARFRPLVELVEIVRVVLDLAGQSGEYSKLAGAVCA